MDRFVVKEPRAGASFPQGNQMMAFPASARSGSIGLPENAYYGGYPANFHNGPNVVNMPQNMNSPLMGQTQKLSPAGPNNMVPQSHISGIDPRYLAAYGESSPQYLIAGQQMQRQFPINSFGIDYQNRSLGGVDRTPKHTHVMALGGLEASKVEEMPKIPVTVPNAKNTQNLNLSFHQSIPMSKKPSDLDLIRIDVQNQMMSRADKLKALHKNGPRAFSGPIEKVLKWHKSLQDVGLLIIYEIVAKCVSVRPGESCAKNLVIRDDNGPAMQVVYYEIDFLLPELKPPCTIRVVGRMMAGTCRLQAFNVRPATGDDVTTLPRRAAVAAHHVAKLCKDYGNI